MPAQEQGDDAAVVSGRSISADFTEFSSEFPLRKVHQPKFDLEWAYYQAGPTESGLEPIIFVHGTSGTAGAFFYQIRALSEKGYRVLSAQYPAFNSAEEWCKGFDLFLDAMKCQAVHLFGAGLGGFLAQHFASRYGYRVKSLMLCNTFATTQPFADKAGFLTSVVHQTPTPILRKVVLDAFPEGGMELSAKQAIDWIAQQVVDLPGSDLASRLALNSTASTVGPMVLEQCRMTILESNGETMVPEELRRQLREVVYRSAKVAQLKASGDFPYISRPEEVTLFIEVHMRSVGVGVSRGGGRNEGSYSTGGAGGAATAAAAGAGGEPAAWRREGGPLDTRPPDASGDSSRERQQHRTAWKNPFEDDLL